MNKIYFVIGASGSGKTTAVKSLQASNPSDFEYCYFDSIGVPSPEEMEKKFGGGEGWQRENTKKWTKKMKEEYLAAKSAILDGQTVPSFIEEACIENGVESYKVILFDCADEVRKQRLLKRGQPELADEKMMNWAKYLREESSKRGYEIIDNTYFLPEESKKLLFALLEQK